MTDTLQCYRCGADLAEIALPFSRRDECPDCGRYLHCCRMCVHFDAQVPKQCRDDDAEEVTNKENPNFCDWFEAAPGRFDQKGAGSAAKAEAQLAALFGDTAAGDDQPDALQQAAEDLFRK